MFTTCRNIKNTPHKALNGKIYLSPEVVFLGTVHQSNATLKGFTYELLEQRPAEVGEHFLMGKPARLKKAISKGTYGYWVVKVLDEVKHKHHEFDRWEKA